MKKLMIVNGYIWIVLVPIVVWRFLQDGTINTKWGRLSGSSASNALIGYCLLAGLFGFYSIKESVYHFKRKKKENNKTEL